MKLGEKLRSARQEAGLSQRQLCGDVITRNMLSQIEHGTARPSMETLKYLAGRLEKPVSFFLEEDLICSPNQERMARARELLASGRASEAQTLLQAFRHPDPVLEWEWKYQSCMAALTAAEQALKEGKQLYTRQLLEETGDMASAFPELERRRLLLLGKIPGMELQAVIRELPSLDEELLLRAEAALQEKRGRRALQLLFAAEQQEVPRWNLLCGRALLLEMQYEQAVQCLKKAEQEYPEICWPLLETAFRELKDFQQAYFYACKQR